MVFYCFKRITDVLSQNPEIFHFLHTIDLDIPSLKRFTDRYPSHAVVFNSLLIELAHHIVSRDALTHL